MLIVPGMPPLQGQSQTRRSRELGKRLDQAVHDYRRDNPELTDGEVQAALTASLHAVSQSPARPNQQRIAIAVVGAIAAAIGAVVAITSGSRGFASGLKGDLAIPVIAGVVAVGGVLIALIRLARRN